MRSYLKEVSKDFFTIITTIIFYNYIYKSCSYFFPDNKEIISILSSSFVAFIVANIQFFVFTLIPKHLFRGRIADINVSISNRLSTKKEAYINVKRKNLKDNSVFELKATVGVKVHRKYLFNLMNKLGAMVFIYATPPDTLHFARSSGVEYKRCRIIDNKGVFINCFFISKNGEKDEYSWDINFAAQIFDNTCSKIKIFYEIALGTKNPQKLLKKDIINNEIFNIINNKIFNLYNKCFVIKIE